MSLLLQNPPSLLIQFVFSAYVIYVETEVNNV